MYRILASIFFLVAGHCLSAQVEKRTLFVGGSSSFSTGGVITKNNNSFQFSLAPKVGYFVIDRLCVGGMTQFWLSFSNGNTSFQYSAGPFIRGYFPISTKLKWFLEGNVMPGGTYYNGNTFLPPTNNFVVSGGGGPGLTLFVNPSLGIDFQLSFMGAGGENADPAFIMAFGIGVNGFLSLGSRN